MGLLSWPRRAIRGLLDVNDPQSWRDLDITPNFANPGGVFETNAFFDPRTNFQQPQSDSISPGFRPPALPLNLLQALPANAPIRSDFSLTEGHSSHRAQQAGHSNFTARPRSATPPGQAKPKHVIGLPALPSPRFAGVPMLPLPTDPAVREQDRQGRIGWIAEQKEGGKKGVHAISNGKNDPGSVSYGANQL